MSNQQNNQNQTGDEMYEQSKQMAKKAGGKVGRKVGNAVKKTTKNAMKKIASKLGKQALKVIGKALLKVGLLLIKAIISFCIAFAVPLLIILGFVFIIAIIWYVIDLEDDGNEQKYYDNNNSTKIVKGQSYSYKVADGDLYGKNGALKEFYTKVAQESFWQILPEEAYKHNPTIQLDELKLYTETGVMDYYEREKQIFLSSTLLFLLDEYLNEKFFIYPEQFTKPLYVDGKTMKLNSLLDDKNYVIPKVDIYDKDGNKTILNKKSVGNHGLAAIIKYENDEIIQTVEGTVTGREYYDDNCECVEKQPLSEPFKYTLDGFPEKIHLIQEMTTVDGLTKYGYKRNKKELSKMSGESTEKASEAVKIFLQEVPQYRKEERLVRDENGDPKLNDDGEPITETVRVQIGTVKLYEYREGAVYLDEPVVDDSKTEKQTVDFNYLNQYLLNYEAVVPMSVMKEFNFEERMGGLYASSSGATVSDLLRSSTLEVGSKTNQDMYKNNYSKYFSYFKKWTDVYGGDPYLLLAKMMLESGGNPNINADGLMQIVGGTRSITATRLDGVKETYTITVPEKKDPDKAIRFAVMYNKNKLDAHGGNGLKALQAYNFDVSGVFKQKWPDLWATDTGWLDFGKIEIARGILATKENYSNSKSANTSCGIQSTGSYNWGNTCYVPMVLQYYAGTDTTLFDDVDTTGKTNPNVVVSQGGLYSYDPSVISGSSQTAQPNAKVVTNPNSYLVVVNKDNKLTTNYVPGDLRELKDVAVKDKSTTKMRMDAATQLEKMLKSAKNEGVELGVFSGYRSYTDQEAAFSKHNNESISAKAGYSEHQTGLAADIVAKADLQKSSSDVLTASFGNTKEGKWLAANATKFGFIIRFLDGKTANTGYSYEPWHVRYVGVDYAQKIMDGGPTLEEAIANGTLEKAGAEKLVAPNGSGPGGTSDFDTEFEEKNKDDGFLKKLFSVIKEKMSYRDETKFYNYRNPISASEATDLKKELVAYQSKKPYSLIKLDEDNLILFGELDSIYGGGTTVGGESISPTTINTEGYSSPLNIPDARSKVTSKFGMRTLRGVTKMHNGIDFGIPVGTPLYSVAPGKVVYIEKYKGDDERYYAYGWGSVVIVQHAGGVRSIYAHLSGTSVELNQEVTNGTLVGYSGNSGYSTGPHLHFEMRLNNQPFDPINIALIGY